MGSIGTIIGGAGGALLGGPAGAVAGASIGQAIGGGVDSLTGSGATSQSTTKNIQPASPEELALRKRLMAGTDFSNVPGASSQGDIEAAFKQSLAQYLASSQGGAPSKDVLDRATSYIDATFTNPAQQSFDQFQRQYMAQQNEQAAALGRQPMDSSIQQQNFRTLADKSADIGAQRGSLIAQRSNQIPQENLNFINNLNQQAFQNRVGLMNLQSGLANNMQQYRLSAAGANTVNAGPDRGLFGDIGAIGQGIGGLNDAYGKAKDVFGGGLSGLFSGNQPIAGSTKIIGARGTNIEGA
jgi:hypothetical protein